MFGSALRIDHEAEGVHLNEWKADHSLKAKDMWCIECKACTCMGHGGLVVHCGLNIS